MMEFQFGFLLLLFTAELLYWSFYCEDPLD